MFVNAKNKTLNYSKDNPSFIVAQLVCSWYTNFDKLNNFKI